MQTLKLYETMRNVPKPTKYINPMIDWAFKKIFKDSGNKQLLIRPLNEIFKLRIADLEIRESEQLGSSQENRNASFDLFCTSRDGEQFIIEIQLSRQVYFLERALFYTSLTISQAATKGDWNYNVPPVFFLGLLNFDFRKLKGHSDSDTSQFIHRFSLNNAESGEQMTDKLQFVFMEIERFDKRAEECGSFEEKFLYMMKNLPTFAEEPELLWDDPYFASLLSEANYVGMTAAQKEEYEDAMRRDWDYKNTIDCAHDEGFAEGEAKGRAEGEAKEQRAIARRMLAEGLSAEVVAKCTGLAAGQVKELLKG